VSSVAPSVLDHLLYAGPDLGEAVALIAELTGVSAVPGGRHLDLGTANYLIGLGPGAYLEIIGPDPQAADPPQAGWLGLAGLPAARLLTWAVRSGDIDAAVSSARAAGYDPGSATPMSRRTEDGTVLHWRLTPDTVASSGGTVSFLIDWGSTAHPSTRALPDLTLTALTASHPDPERHAAVRAGYGARCPARVGRAHRCRGRATRRGRRELSRSQMSRLS